MTSFPVKTARYDARAIWGLLALILGSWLHEHPTPQFRCPHCTASFPAWALLAAHELQHRKDSHV